MRYHHFSGSSFLSGFNYNPDSRQLDCRTRSGGVFSHYGVPADLVDEFQNCESAGKFWHERLKGNYGEKDEGG